MQRYGIDLCSGFHALAGTVDAESAWDIVHYHSTATTVRYLLNILDRHAFCFCWRAHAGSLDTGLTNFVVLDVLLSLSQGPARGLFNARESCPPWSEQCAQERQP